jgi:hypothetical protein
MQLHDRHCQQDRYEPQIAFSRADRLVLAFVLILVATTKRVMRKETDEMQAHHTLTTHDKRLDTA